MWPVLFLQISHTSNYSVKDKISPCFDEENKTRSTGLCILLDSYPHYCTFKGPDTYDCGQFSPCANPNGQFYYPHHEITKFVQCDAFGGCFVKDCGPGTVYNPDLFVCVHAPGTIQSKLLCQLSRYSWIYFALSLTCQSATCLLTLEIALWKKTSSLKMVN